jgi:hypothetical protein
MNTIEPGVNDILTTVPISKNDFILSFTGESY